MLRSELDSLLADVLADRRLLEHPFYCRWEAGDLSLSELAAYAGQYRHFERELPDFLRGITAKIDESGAKEMVQNSLNDELGAPEPHLELFDRFASGVGGRTGDEPTAATEALLAVYGSLSKLADPSFVLAAIAAYEVQAAEIAASKARGLRVHYGLEETHTRFWDVHSTIDSTHSEWTLDALASIARDGEGVRVAARRAAEAWWSFLDERQEVGCAVFAA